MSDNFVASYKYKTKQKKIPSSSFPPLSLHQNQTPALCQVARVMLIFRASPRCWISFKRRNTSGEKSKGIKVRANQPFKSLDFICWGKFLGLGGKKNKFAVRKKKKKRSLVCVSFGNGSSEAVDKVRTSLLLPRSTQAVFHAAAVWDQRGRAGREESVSLSSEYTVRVFL